MKNNEPVVKNNLGAVALYEGDIDNAETYFGAAAGAGNEVNYNQGIVNVKKADYDQAVRYFGDYKDENSAVAKIMAGDNNGALKDLEASDNPDSSMNAYLKAVIGARTAKENMMYENLSKAVEMKS